MSRGVELAEAHKQILETIGHTGAELSQVHRHGREVGELSAAHLIVFWPHGGPRPPEIYGSGATPGRWYLTHAGADAAQLEPPTLRMS